MLNYAMHVCNVMHFFMYSKILVRLHCNLFNKLTVSESYYTRAKRIQSLNSQMEPPDLDPNKVLSLFDLVSHRYPTIQRLFDIADEKGVSSWLNCLPISDHGFNLHKRVFWDALCLQYGSQPHAYLLLVLVALLSQLITVLK